MRVAILALGSDFNGDDSAGLEAARALQARGAHVEMLGRPGPSLLDWFSPERALVIVDAVRSIEPGTIVEIPLDSLTQSAVAHRSNSTHGMGVAAAFELAQAMGYPTPEGVFVGVGGATFAQGAAMSAAVRAAIPSLIERVLAAVTRYRDEQSNEEPCTNTGS